MKLIIAGSRNIDVSIEFINDLIWTHFVTNLPSEIVCGMARGIDLCGKQWADILGKIPVKEMPAAWKFDGRKAGFVRNIAMAEYADQLLAIWDGNSNGTRHMIQEMLLRKKPIHVELYVKTKET